MRTTIPHRARARFPLVFFPLALLVACGDAGGPRDPAEDIPLNAVTEEVFTVGSVTGDAWDTFGELATVAFDAASNLHILDGQAQRIYMVGPDGSLLRTVGGPGEGPGELNEAGRLIVARDGSYTVTAFGRIDRFAPGGEFVERVTLDPFTTGQIIANMALPDGRLVTATILGGDDEDEEEAESSRPIYLFPLDGTEPQLLYTAWDLPEDETDSEFTGEVMRIGAGRAFEPGLYYDLLTDGRLALVDSIGYRVKLIGLDGSVTATIERPIAPLAVDDAIREAARERFRQFNADLLEGLARLDLNFRVEREGAEELAFADEVPVIGGLEVDWEDRIWLERRDSTGGPDGPIDIVTPEGDYIGTLPPDGLRTPAAFGPDGLMAFIDRDEFDVPTVRVVRLVALEPAG